MLGVFGVPLDEGMVIPCMGIDTSSKRIQKDPKGMSGSRARDHRNEDNCNGKVNLK